MYRPLVLYTKDKGKMLMMRELLLCILISLVAISALAGQSGINWQRLANIENSATKIKQIQLPAPYDYLLTQPLMTKGMETWYQRTAIIQPLYAVNNQAEHTYSRAILMLLDNNKSRNNPQIAQGKKEAVVVELAFITMNFKALPKKLISAVLNTSIPFGKLLTASDIKTGTTDRTYFWVSCDRLLASLMHCRLREKLYGRSNTIIKADNKQWLARAIEILR